MKVRFAPSPTGFFHIGTLRAALFNYLLAKSCSGFFTLRIEDTDKERSKPEFEANIVESLKWLGLHVDEGPESGGDVGPYRQSERVKQGVYQKYVDKLLNEDQAYYCFLTTEEIENHKQAAKDAGKPYIHDRSLSFVSEAEKEQFLAAGKPFVIRFKMTKDQTILVKDLIRKDIEFDCKLQSDFVIMKSDGTPSFNFAVVVDDALMNITHVVRGEDHLSNMPKQLALFEALGLTAPKFAHLPMILGPDKSKLSKRHGATAVTDYQKQGFLKEAILNYLSLLGWSPVGEHELMPIEQICNEFSLDRVSRSNAVFDIQKLTWMNGQYIRQKDAKTLYELVQPFLSDEYKKRSENVSKDKMIEAVTAVQDNFNTLVEINDYIGVFLETEQEYQTQIEQVRFNESDQVVFNQFMLECEISKPQTSADFDRVLNDCCSKTGLGKGKVFKPIRLAVTAKSSGPHIGDVLSFFGADTCISRIKHFI